MTILEKIIADKYIEVRLRKSVLPVAQLVKTELFDRETISLKDRLRNSNSGIIAEHKRRSPSKAIINTSLNVFDVAQGYEDAGASGMSVLTDGKYFGGSLDDLLTARASCNLPLLRKEFIIDEYQLLAAKAFGADVVLLIAALLSRKEIVHFSGFAKELGLEVLLEVHDEEELKKSLMPSIDMIGVNNRNLETFEVDTEISKRLSGLIPNEFVKVSESGISDVQTIKELQQFGFQGFLIGENFMKTNDPGKSAKEFIDKLL